jgi:hypothetical protein
MCETIIELLSRTEIVAKPGVSGDNGLLSGE